MNQSQNTNKSYIPGLHPEMPDWKKVIRYVALVSDQFPRLDGKPVDTSTVEFRAQAIEFVNYEIQQDCIRRAKKAEDDRLAYEARCRRRDELRIQEEAEKQRKEAEKEAEDRKKEEAHVAEMKKKYGYGWENDVDGTDEDCRTAYEMRLDWERVDECQEYQSRIAAARWQEECEEQMNKDDHENTLFDVRMELETRGMTPSVKNTYIQEKRLDHLGKRWEREYQEEAAFYNEGQQTYRAIETDSKKSIIASYLALK